MSAEAAAMTPSFKRLSDELDRLIHEGDELSAALEVYAGKRAEILAAFGDDKRGLRSPPG